MPDSVREALTNIIRVEGKRTESEADVYMSELLKQKRYQCETWS